MIIIIIMCIYIYIHNVSDEAALLIRPGVIRPGLCSPNSHWGHGCFTWGFVYICYVGIYIYIYIWIQFHQLWFQTKPWNISRFVQHLILYETLYYTKPTYDFKLSPVGERGREEVTETCRTPERDEHNIRKQKKLNIQLNNT